MSAAEKYLVTRLLKWNTDSNDRQMPWKGEKDPYRIWLSEIILQQTRVEQGWNYYNRFIEAFPNIKALAKAPETTVFKLWEGLGYYSRCKNLIATAKFIAENNKGKFPDTYEDIVALKGVGPYTAAAIASFAYNLPHAVVDGNVFRVLSRYFGIDTPIDSVAGKKLFTGLANKLLDVKQPGIYNQALMDFGAVICKPKLPLCSTCPLNSKCVAYLTGYVDKLPVKEKSIIKKTRWFYFLRITYADKVYVRKRTESDIWQNLYEFVLLENDGPVENITTVESFKNVFGSIKFNITRVSQVYRQQLTHQTIHGQFISITINKPLALKGYQPVSPGELALLPFPKFITHYLSDKNVSLNLF